MDAPLTVTQFNERINLLISHSDLVTDIAVTGEISLYGRVRPVGGVFEKAYGAKQAGMKTLVIPAENKKDIPESHLGLSIHPVETAEEAFRLLFADGWKEGGDGDD